MLRAKRSGQWHKLSFLSSALFQRYCSINKKPLNFKWRRSYTFITRKQVRMLHICFLSRQGSLWTRLDLETCIKPGKISNIVDVIKIPKLVIYTWGQFVPVHWLVCPLFLDWWMLNALSFFKTMNAFNMHNLQRGYSWNVVEPIIAYNQFQTPPPPFFFLNG